VAHGGYYPWPHWDRNNVIRPYDFEWNNLKSVTCVAQDRYRTQYPVTEDGYEGSTYQDRMSEIEQATVDRCFAESNDTDCQLVSCTPEY
jgi:hypothetical protein